MMIILIDLVVFVVYIPHCVSSYIPHSQSINQSIWYCLYMNNTPSFTIKKYLFFLCPLPIVIIIILIMVSSTNMASIYIYILPLVYSTLHYPSHSPLTYSPANVYIHHQSWCNILLHWHWLC